MTTNPDPSLLAFLRDPASYPHRPAGLREVHTHASLVFLVPPLVYKIKRPVDFGFLDFSSLEKRRHFCQREVDLNSRLAPGIYQGVAAITRRGRGFEFDGDGPVTEYAVKMSYMEPEGFLDARLKAGTAGRKEISRVAQALADFYRQQPSPPDVAKWGTVEKLRLSTDENFAQTEAFIGKTISRSAFETIREFTEYSYTSRRSAFDRRVAGGWIRDCHGDLHLDHIHITGEALHIYDCIEFNDRFRHLDVASDVAFLAMDLDFHDHPDLARHLVRRIAKLLEDREMERLMDFHKCYRAYVRGKVESLHSTSPMADAREKQAAARKAKRYFKLALAYAVCSVRQQTIVVMGRVASGKSTLATAIARELGWPLISSDALRKSLANVPLHHRGDAAERRKLYSPAKTELTYETMIRQAKELLLSGRGVILDATFSNRHLRDRLRECIGDRNLQWILATADDATTRRRLLERESRPGVTSDARISDREMLDSAFSPPDEIPANRLTRISTEGRPVAVVRRLLAAMTRSRR